MKKTLRSFQAIMLLSAMAFVGSAFITPKTQAIEGGCIELGCRWAGCGVCAETIVNGNLVTCQFQAGDPRGSGCD
ncbi:MAG: hypothetical protein K0U98_06630 [Deltaproteobacteria bacterium]|nr:hypothetical protein [Deltaproteobacteria bacterium]